MKKTTDIWLYIILSLMSAGVILAMTTVEIIDPSYEYKRGYMDGFRDGMLMNDTGCGTIKLESKGGEE